MNQQSSTTTTTTLEQQQQQQQRRREICDLQRWPNKLQTDEGHCEQQNTAANPTKKKSMATNNRGKGKDLHAVANKELKPEQRCLRQKWLAVQKSRNLMRWESGRALQRFHMPPFFYCTPAPLRLPPLSCHTCTSTLGIRQHTSKETHTHTHTSFIHGAGAFKGEDVSWTGHRAVVIRQIWLCWLVGLQ